MSGSRRFVITVDGRRHDVEVQPSSGDGGTDGGTDGATRVTVDGQTRWVTDGAGGVQLVRASPSGSQVRVSLPDGPRPQSASTPGQTHDVLVRTARQAAHDDAEAAASGASGGRARIEAPMPGRVVKVLVVDGEAVDVGAALVIVEAMKMENEVRAPVAGRVTQLSVEAGATVEPGQVMCVLEPEAEPDAG
ncbi:MAG: biotin/lipoyl-containing protein [Myxococcota bacterium]